MRIVTRCTTVEQFITIFRQFCHEGSCFIPSTDGRPVGSDTAFSIRLADGTPVLRGLCVVLESWATDDNPFRRPGVFIGIRRLTADSAAVYQQLQARTTEAMEPLDSDGEPRRRRAPDTIAEPFTAPPPDPDPELPPVRARTSTDGEQLIPDVSPAPTDVPMTAMITSGDTSTPIQVGTLASPPTSQPLPVAKLPGVRVTTSIPPLGDAQVPVRATPTVETPPLQLAYEVETRAPGSGWVLPANPLTALSDDKLEAFIDCTLYEETEAAVVPEVLALPKDGAEAKPEPAEPAAPTLAAALAGTPPVKGREQMATLLGVAPLVVPKADAPILAQPQAPKPFVRPTTPKPDEGKPEEPNVVVATEPVVAETRASTESVRRSVIKPRDAAIALACAIALVIVVVLASSSGKRAAKPAIDAGPRPVEPTSKVVPPDEPPDEAPPPAVEPEIEMSPDEVPTTVAKTTCKLTVTSTPSGAWVRIDSKNVGVSPITVEGPCKRRKVAVAANGYDEQTRRVVVKDGDTLAFELVKRVGKPAITKQPPTTKPTKPTPATTAKPKGTVDI